MGATKGSKGKDAWKNLPLADLRIKHAELLTEHRVLRKHRLGANWASVLRTLFKWVPASWAVVHFAGTATSFVAEVRGLAELGEACSSLIDTLEKFFYLGLAFLLLALIQLWVTRRSIRLHKDSIKRFGDLVPRLESQINPNRKSSLLAKDGTSHPEDEA